MTLLEPSDLTLDPSIGQQHSSLRPTSAQYSIPRGPRLPESCAETPGPTTYDVCSAVRSAAPVIGKAPLDSYLKPYPYPDVQDDEDVGIPDSSKLRYPASARAVFGTEQRDAELTNANLLRVSPEAGLGQQSPGFVYTPSDRKTRPRSAPSYTMRARGHRSSQPQEKPGSTPEKYQPQPSMGAQIQSKRRTARASSFGRASRFAESKPVGGELTAECKSVGSAFGGDNVGKHRRPTSATFGEAKRDDNARMRPCHDSAGYPGACRAPPRMPHPPVAPRKELIRYGSRY